MRFHPRTRLAVGALLTPLLTAVLAVGTPVGVQAAGMSEERGATHADRRLTVMTQNLYLGSSLNAAMQATGPAEFVQAVATIYGTAVFTNFPRRAEAIADTIEAEEPDLVGLQEVTRWIAQPTHAGPTPPSYDFLAILQAALDARGLDYEVASVAENADIGPAPLVAPGFGCAGPTSASWVPDCVVSLQDRDVILVNEETENLHVRASDSGTYLAQEVLTLPGGTEASFARGWTYVDATYRGRRFRFANTHLEVEEFAATQEAQAAEFLAGPASAPTVIATGDFNSAADPSTTDTPTSTYADLTRDWFDDAWSVNGSDPGLTCCQNSSLTNPVSLLRTRIDLVLTHGRVSALSAHRVGHTPMTPGAPPPYWASDHAGVVATVRLR